MNANTIETVIVDVMWLQLFAEPNTNVTTSTAVGNDLSPEMKTHYDMTLIDEAGPKLVHDQFGQQRPIPKGSGKTIEFRKFDSLPKATTALTEGVTPDGGKLNVTALTATVKQYGYYIVQSDMLELTALDNTILEATKLLGDQAGRTLDTITRNVLNAGTNVSFASKWSGDTETVVEERGDLDMTATLKVDTIQRVVAKLRAQNARTFEGGTYMAVIHPYVAYDLMRDPEWIDAHKYAAPENLYKGEIGQIAGVRFVESTEAKIWRDNTCPVYTPGSPAFYAVFSCLFFGKDAYGVTQIEGGGLQTIIKQKGSSGVADALDQRSSIGWKATKTAEILLPNNLVRVECMSHFSTSAQAN